MRDGIGTSVSGIVHNQCTLLHLLFDEPRHVGIAVSRRRTDTGVSIPHHTLYLISRIEPFHLPCHAIGILHVGILIAIVTHKAKQVLPGTGILVVDIALYLVYSNASIVGCTR